MTCDTSHLKTYILKYAKLYLYPPFCIGLKLGLLPYAKNIDGGSSITEQLGEYYNLLALQVGEVTQEWGKLHNERLHRLPARYRPGVAQRVGRDIALLFHDRGTRRG